MGVTGSDFDMVAFIFSSNCNDLGRSPDHLFFNSLVSWLSSAMVVRDPSSVVTFCCGVLRTKLNSFIEDLSLDEGEFFGVLDFDSDSPLSSASLLIIKKDI